MSLPLIERPANLSLKDFLIRKISARLMLSEKSIAPIIDFQFQDARAALHTHREVELSGLGKFVFQQHLGRKRQAQLLEMRGHLERKAPSPSRDKKLLGIEVELQYLQSKILPHENQFEPTDGGLAQPPVSPRGVEAENPGGLRAEDEILPGL
jgi:hypothetical protein